MNTGKKEKTPLSCANDISGHIGNQRQLTGNY